MKQQHFRRVAATGLALALFGVVSSLPADVGDNFSDWSTPVNIGPPVNSILADQAPFISKDGLSLYFTCVNCPGGKGGFDIWVAQRASASDPWGTPQNLTSVNTNGLESSPYLSPDGHHLYFFSNRAGGFGGTDLYVSRRHNKRDDLGWREPINLGSGVNTATAEITPAVFEDDATGAITLYFASNRAQPGSLGGQDIYVSTLEPDEVFGPAVLVAELSSPASDQRPVLRRDGLELFLSSDRAGTVGGLDLWVSTRASTSDPWSIPVNLGSGVNSATIDNGPALGFDGMEIYFHSDRSGTVGGIDLWVSTRSKL